MAYDWKQREVKENIDYEIFRPRIQFMSKFLVSDDRSVADFGCGTMILKDFLDENVKYYPIDYVDRGEGTILCDFNKKEFPHSIKSLDCAFMSGFLQYIDSPQWLISKLSSICKKVIITYPTIDYFNDIEDRKSRAWRNHLTQEELISHFTKNNFMVSEIEHRDDFKQLLIVFKNGKNYPVDDNLLCCGCSACKMKCPVGAISIEQDRNGRFRAFIDKEKCTQCGICANTCPIINPQFKNTDNPKCFAFDTTEKLSHDSATAGGFQILAKHFINNGGKVVGAAWAADEHGNYTTVKHIMVDNLKDLKSLYKSKYLQSDMTNIYEQTKQELEKGTTILFSGVSCQIAGLYSMLGNDYENLYTIDLICHHAPSQGYFKKYLNEQFGENNVKEFDFRAKDKENPYNLTYRVKLKSGEEILKSHWEDSFCRLFHERVIMAKSCENCQFAKYPKQGDITLGDFHRIEETDPDFLDFRTEAVLINNKKGEKLFQILQKETTNLKEKDLALLSKGNKVCENYQAHPKRNLFIELIANNMPVTQATNIVINNYYDIGLVGMPGNNNYGGALTYYALYNVLRDMGKSVLFIQQPENSEWKPSIKMSAWKNNPYKSFDFAKTYPNKDAMRELNQFCDMFMVGSDQFFASIGLYEICNKFTSLDWADNRKKKVAYAASFGRDTLSCDDYNRAQMGYFLSKFDKFTVREANAVDLCRKEFGIDAEVVLDPVFLCPLEYYEKLIESGNYKSNNKIATYVLDKTISFQNIIEDLKQTLNTEDVSIADAYKDCDYNDINEEMPKIEDWLYMIKNCKFFVTDSFHGMCFAIIFKKPFIAICNKNRGAARFESLVKLLGLETRLIYKEDNYYKIKQSLQNIDWQCVYKKLSSLQEASRVILYDMLQPTVCKKNTSDYNLYKPEIAFLKYENYLKSEQINEIETRVNIELPQNLSTINNDIAQISSKIKENFKNNFIDLVINKRTQKPFSNVEDDIPNIDSSKISVVVQGAINPQITPQCLKSIRTYLPEAEVILSTWQGTNINGLDYDILILNNDPGGIKMDLVNNVINNQNRQLVSTREGIFKASKKYILKLRTDFILHSSKFLLYWNKFNTRKEEYNIFRHKIITSSVFSREFSDYNHRPVLFHPSDFFLFGLAEDLKDYFKDIRFATDNELGNWQYLYPNKIPYPEAHFRYAPEQFFLLSYAKQFFPDINFEDWSDWDATNQKLSKNILYNNFIFLDYKQAEIYSEKFANELENPDKLYGLISFKHYEEVYRTDFDNTYVPEKEDVIESESDNLDVVVVEKTLPVGFEEYQNLNLKFKKHLSYFVTPFKKIITWILQPIPILYNLSKLFFNIYFIRRILSCFIVNKQKRKEFRGDI